ncbi:MAG: Thioredoxin reductase (EC [uncultured Campylobacterales bacterium]|uniref:Thioredoxin reductase n=1 Tax=uncultured Campylobacterales bacterium TaxID=352960 RepID=A0A6S6SAB6_9BACT|nr:MAG: Thioredoxin reductase (EC [uncultured Campylobacterales bacterium]
MIDLAIIGGGPAGLTAGLYATRGGLKDVVMYEFGMPGGQITQSSEIENYPGVPKVVTGMELMESWPEQCQRFGLKHEIKEVLNVSKEGDTFKLLFAKDEIVEAKSVLICTGSKPRRAGVEGEDKFFGRGVSTCATCDGFFYKDGEVAVLGGGDTALEEALFLANICSKVYLIHRREEFRAAPSTTEKVLNNPKIELVLNSTVEEIQGDNAGVTGVITKNKDGETRDIKVPGIFVFVGMLPQNKILFDENDKSLCELSKAGQIVVDLKMKTSVPGLFAAGDIRIDAAKQVVCASGDGATAGIGAIEYVND